MPSSRGVSTRVSPFLLFASVSTRVSPFLLFASVSTRISPFLLFAWRRYSRQCVYTCLSFSLVCLASLF